MEEIRRQLRSAAVVNLGETGCHVGGKLKWVHGAATERLTLLGVDDQRGVDGIKSLGVLEEMTGVVHAGNQRLLKHLGKERDHLFTFLRRSELGVPATNWRAEQGIRPAVMIRKTWGGNATWTGAGTQERLMSVCRTGRQQSIDLIEALTELQRQRQPGLLPGLILPAPGRDRGGCAPSRSATDGDCNLRWPAPTRSQPGCTIGSSPTRSATTTSSFSPATP